MDWKNFDIDGWNCMVDRSDGTVLAFSDDGTKRIECCALETKWLGMSDTLNSIIQGARMEIDYRNSRKTPAFRHGDIRLQ